MFHIKIWSNCEYRRLYVTFEVLDVCVNENFE
jgi:hypothetical protein